MHGHIIFVSHIALALTLIAAVAGCFLLSKSCSEGAVCKKTGTVVGILVLILTLLSTVCIIYHTATRCDKGCYKKQKALHHSLPMEGWKHPPIDESEK